MYKDVLTAFGWLGLGLTIGYTIAVTYLGRKQKAINAQILKIIDESSEANVIKIGDLFQNKRLDA